MKSSWGNPVDLGLVAELGQAGDEEAQRGGTVQVAGRRAGGRPGATSAQSGGEEVGLGKEELGLEAEVELGPARGG